MLWGKMRWSEMRCDDHMQRYGQRCDVTIRWRDVIVIRHYYEGR